jgi:hypothetical protein
MKLLGFLRSLVASAAVLLALPALAVQAQSPGPPRTEPIAGDEAASPLIEAEIANLRAFARVYTVARWFHPSDAALAADWDAIAIEAVPQVIAARGPEELAKVLSQTFTPIVEGFEVANQPLGPVAASPSPAERWRWLHSGFTGSVNTGYFKRRNSYRSLGIGEFFDEQIATGLWVRFPTSATKNGDETPEMVPQQSFAGKPEGWTPAGFDRTTRIAATIIAWGVFDQFYPYWDVVDVDWDERLDVQLHRAATAQDDSEFAAALRIMLNELQDGHARLVYNQSRRGLIPLIFERIEGRIVVAWAEESLGIEPGSMVSTIDGMAIDELLVDVMENRSSGSEHVRQRVALDRLIYGPLDTVAKVALTSPDGQARTIEIPRIPFSWDAVPEMPRPDPVAELESGLLYVDLTRTTDDMLIAAADRLVEAKGIVFDLRGGPAGSPMILSHLTDKVVLSARFEKQVYEFPDQVNPQYADSAWRIVPQSPQLTRNIVFLTNADAASYPESILGTVKGNGLGTIVGSPTAGANGNVSMVDVPGGYRLYFTGMKVINRDGSVHHNIGVLPDVAVEPTLEGIRQGRDEVLEAGLDVVRAALANS